MLSSGTPLSGTDGQRVGGRAPTGAAQDVENELPRLRVILEGLATRAVDVQLAATCHGTWTKRRTAEPETANALRIVLLVRSGTRSRKPRPTCS